MMYSVDCQKNFITIEEFKGKYQNREKFLAYCKECPRYNNTWSCPPLAFDVNEYLDKYTYVYVVCAKITLTDQVIREADTPDKVKDMGWKILCEVKANLEEKLRSMERLVPESISLSSGGCNNCNICTRKDGIPCRLPDKMRYSMDAFGFDLTAITKDLFDIDIQWCKDSLPKYFTLIHGLLTKSKVKDELWNF